MERKKPDERVESRDDVSLSCCFGRSGRSRNLVWVNWMYVPLGMWTAMLGAFKCMRVHGLSIMR
jgi:hypothetical protein